MGITDELTNLATEILDEFTSRGLSLAIAESCTGGLATSYLTDIDGCSEVLNFSIITYSNESKEEFLGIPHYITRDFGMISSECAKAMAEGLLEYDVDFGLATTGIIGESIENKLKGTAHIAVATAGYETFVNDLQLDPKKSRVALKNEIVQKLFELVLEVVKNIF